MKDDALNVEIKTHANGVGGNKDVAWMIGIVEILSLRSLIMGYYEKSEQVACNVDGTVTTNIHGNVNLSIF